MGGEWTLEEEESNAPTLTEMSVSEEWQGLRCDQVVTALFEQIPSRSFAARLFELGLVKLNGKTPKPSQKCRVGDALQVDLSLLWERNPIPHPEKIPITILYEDNDLIVVNKSAGMVVHPGAGVYSGTLVNAILAHCGQTLPSTGGASRAGIVHRLDRDTSGVMVVAKSQRALTGLAQQFATHAQRREYAALVWGDFPKAEQRIETLHGRDPRHRTKFAVVSEGKPARMRAVGSEWFLQHKISLVTCTLETGRTHQIRVQLTHLKHPLLGDLVYTQPFSSRILEKPLFAELQPLLRRQMLHAKLLGFVHPGTGQTMEFSAEPPEDFQAVLNFLRQHSR